MQRRSVLKGAGAAALVSTLPRVAAADSLPFEAPVHALDGWRASLADHRQAAKHNLRQN